MSQLSCSISKNNQILKWKIQWFGKGKISLTTISSNLQKESRPFGNLFALIVLWLKNMKKELSKIDITNVASNNKVVPNNRDIEANSNFEESEGTLPKESWDETNSYYNGSRNADSSNEPTPKQQKPKKSLVKVKNQINTPSRVSVAKKGCQSSENKSSGGTRKKKNEVNDYVSPVKKTIGTKPKMK
jgi:hypothetical protein